MPCIKTKIPYQNMTVGGILGGGCGSWIRVGFGGMTSAECEALSDEPRFVWGCLVFCGGCVVGFYVGPGIAVAAGSVIFGHDIPSVLVSNIGDVNDRN